MALGLNHALLIGTLVREPDLRYTPAGLAVLRLDLGGDDHLPDEHGVVRARPWYHRVTSFGLQAERVVDHVHAGTPVLVDGHLEHRTWESAEGEPRRALDVIGRRVEILGLGARDEGDAYAIDAREQPRLRDARNAVRIIGNVTRDAELRRTEGGHALARFSVAVNDRRGEDEKTHFVDVQAWREVARGCDELSRGDPVYVEGRLVTDAWTDEGGSRRYSTRLEARRIERIARLPHTPTSPPPPEPGAATDRAEPEGEAAA